VLDSEASSSQACLVAPMSWEHEEGVRKGKVPIWRS
jgi:hypothetical protein